MTIKNATGIIDFAKALDEAGYYVKLESAMFSDTRTEKQKKDD